MAFGIGRSLMTSRRGLVPGVLSALLTALMLGLAIVFRADLWFQAACLATLLVSVAAIVRTRQGRCGASMLVAVLQIALGVLGLASFGLVLLAAGAFSVLSCEPRDRPGSEMRPV